MYSLLLEDRARMEAKMRPYNIAGIGVRETARIGVGVLLLLLEALEVPPANLSLLIRGELQQALQLIHAPAMLIGWIKKVRTFFSKRVCWPVRFGAFKIVIGLTQ